MDDNRQKTFSALSQVADYLRAQKTPPLCFVSHPQLAANLRRQWTGDSRLPIILSPARFFDAAAALPAASAKKVILAAALNAPPPQNNLTPAVFNVLPATMKKQTAAAMQLAGATAGLLTQLFEANLSSPSRVNLFLNENTRRREIAVLKVLWDIFYDAMNKGHQHCLRLAREIKQPVVAVGDDDSFSPREKDFLQTGGCVFFQAASGELEKELRACLSADNAPPSSPLLAAHFIFRQGSAARLGDAAQLALQEIQQTLQTSPDEKIGVVVYNRLLARRLRAQCETRGILIKDDGGWRGGTLSFGAALRLFAQAAARHRPGVVSVLIRPPFWKNNLQKTAAMEQAWQKQLNGGVIFPESWRDYGDGDSLPSVLSALADAPESATLRRWTDWLFVAAADFLAAWKDDWVGGELREKLVASTRNDDDEKISAAAFVAWLELFLQNETFGEKNINSAVEFVSPSTAVWRRFDSLLLLGINADTAPTADAGADFLGARAKKILNLPRREECNRKQKEQFCKLLAAHKKVSAVWRLIGDNDDEILPSPFWRLLTAAADNVADINLRPDFSLSREVIPPPPAKMFARRRPVSLSITAAGRLMQCPYLFFARDFLRLQETDGEVELSPTLQGSLLHRAINIFGKMSGDDNTVESLSQHWQNAVDETLQKSNRPGVRLLRLYWLTAANNFIANESRRRRDGWKIIGAEKNITAALPLRAETEKPIMIKGRVDRIDENGDGEKQVIDFKSRRQKVHKSVDGEAPQLPLYLYLLGMQNAAAIICQPLIKEGDIETENGASPIRVAARLRGVMRQIADGAALPANGAIKDCNGCEARRLCRRDHWRR